MTKSIEKFINLITILALTPLAFAGDLLGNEKVPLSIVILGGLITASFIIILLILVLFVKWGKK